MQVWLDAEHGQRVCAPAEIRQVPPVFPSPAVSVLPPDHNECGNSWPSGHGHTILRGHAVIHICVVLGDLVMSRGHLCCAGRPRDVSVGT